MELGEAEYILRGTGTKRRRVLASDFFYYVPLSDAVHQLLSHPDIFQEVSRSSASTDGVLRDFCDGRLYKNHPLFSANPCALQIIAYFDEVELCNPLGSSAKKHKLGMFFFTLGNIRPMFRSSLKCISLFAVAKSKDIKKHGLDSILQPFVSDINKLALDGITVGSSNFKGSLIAFLGDNLGSHAAGGFKESMSFAYRFCRSCMATREQSQDHFLEASFELRTPAEHKKHCALLQGPLKDHHSSVYGINRKPILDDIVYFSVATGLPHDIMHDILEGAISFELKALLQHCVAKNYFCIALLNDRIQSFDFGYSEVSNKPALLDDAAVRSNDSKLHQSATQMWLLARTLPLLLGDKVPIEDCNWKCYLLLLKILDICTQHECSEGTVAYLAVLIEEHHTLYKHLYPNLSIKPKLHFMVHYPQQILQFGPLLTQWTM